MKFVNRDGVEAPKVFASERARSMRMALMELLSGDRIKVSQTRTDFDSAFQLLLEDQSIASALHELFSGRCAFCETSNIACEVFQFRPPENAKPIRDRSTSHLYYIWMAYAWQNLYPVCVDCGAETQGHFPVGRTGRAPLPTDEELERYLDREDGRWPTYPLNEKAVLLDPCRDENIWRHLEFKANGQVLGREARGKQTIETFRLNRQSLIRDRKEAFNEDFAKLRQVLQDQEPKTLQWMSGKPGFPGAFEIFVNDLLSEALGKRRSMPNVERNIARLRQLSDGLRRLDATWEEFQRSSENVQHSAQRPSLFRISSDQVPEFSSVKIQNFKALENVKFSLPKFETRMEQKYRVSSLLVLGENATGKSTVLEAVALATIPQEIRGELPIEAAPAILDPVYLGAPGSTEPRFADIEIMYTDGSKQRLEVRSWGLDDQRFSSEGEPPSVPVFAYGAFRQYLKTIKRFSPDKHIRTLFDSGTVLSNPEAWLKKLSDQDFDMVARALRPAFNVERDFDVLKRSAAGVFVVTRLDNKPDGVTQETPLSIVSSGFRSVLAMLCDIFQGLMDERINPSFETLDTARGLVLVDEVEAHLHPRWKMSIMTGLRNALPYVNFIATSHDPLCLRGMGKNEVMVLQRISGAEAASELPVFTQTLTDLPDNETWTVEQLLTADFFQLRTTDSTEDERKMAEMEDLLARGETRETNADLASYLDKLCSGLPIGHTDVHRLVQDAIADYLRQKRTLGNERLSRLRAATRRKIVEALKLG